MKASTIMFLIILAAMVAGILAIGAVIHRGYSIEVKFEEREQEKEEETTKILPVHVTEIGAGSVEDVVYATGFVEEWDRVDCYAKIPFPGLLIKAMVGKGDKVSKNQVLVKVDRDEVGAIYLAYAVKAPMSGIVAYIQDERGSLVSPQQAVATIIKTDKVKVKTSVIGSDMGRVQVGRSARVRFDAYPDRIFSGTIDKIEPVLDEFSHTAVAEITIANGDGALKPGMFAQIEIVAGEKSGVIVIPKGVVMKREGTDRAFVIDADTAEPPALRLFLTEIELGFYNLQSYEVLAGVEAGDLVVDKDLPVLKDRTEISVLNPPEGWVDPSIMEAEEEEVEPDDPAPMDADTAAAPVPGDTAAP